MNQLRQHTELDGGGRRNSCTFHCCYFLIIGQYIILGCGIFIYVYFVLGKLPLVSLHIYQPMISILSSWMIQNETYQHDKATIPLFAIIVPMLVAGMMASMCYFVNSDRRQDCQYQYRSHPLSKTLQTSSSSSSSSSSGIRSNYSNKYHDLGRMQYRVNTFFLRMTNNTNVMIFILIYLPLFVYTTISVLQKLPMSDTSRQQSNRNSILSEIGNTFGITALFGMSFILIPVTKYSFILQYFTYTQNLGIQQRIHQSLGSCIMISVLLHIAFHWYRWYIVQQYSNIWSMVFIIPSSCWTKSGWIQDDSMEQNELLLCRQQDSMETTTNAINSDCTCYGRVRNVMGCVASIALLILSLTTVIIPSFRRYHYRLFYILHRILGPIVFLFVILHWNRSIIYVSGNILYFMAGTFPIWIVNNCTTSRQRSPQPSNTCVTTTNNSVDRHIRITSIEHIAACHDTADKDIIALTFETTKEVIDQQYLHSGQYVKLHVPSISNVAHPFTINQVYDTTTATTTATKYDTSIPSSNNELYQLRILFRCVGPFTKQLARALLPLNDSATPIAITTTCLPKIYLDGFYGPSNRSSQILYQYDHVVFVAGGIGITPYLSLLSNILQMLLHHDASYNDDVVLKKITFYWICRDPKLIEYVQREYFDPIVALWHDDCRPHHCQKIELKINIHQTHHQHKSSDQYPCHREKSIMRISKSASYTNLEQEPANKDDELTTNDINANIIMIQNLGADSGIPFVPSKFYPGPRTTWCSNIVLYTIYTSTVWIGLLIIWYLYTRYQAKDTVLPRVLAPLIIVLHAYLVSRGMYWLLMESPISRQQWNCGRSLYYRKDSNHELVDSVELDSENKSIRMADNCTTRVEELNMSSSVEMGLVPHHDSVELSHCNGKQTDILRPTLTNETGGSDVQVCTRSGTIDLYRYIGRPTVYQILHHIDTDCLSPGIYVCGPSTLMRNIRDAVTERYSRPCRANLPSFIALHEETFEI